MRTMVITYEWPPFGGGMGRRALDFVTALPGNVDVISSGETELLDDLFMLGKRVCRLGVRKRSNHHWTPGELLSWYWRARLWARRIYKDREPDVIFIFGGFPGIYVTPDLSKTRVMLSGSDVPGFSSNILRHLPGYAGRMRKSILISNGLGLSELAYQAFGKMPYRVPSCIRPFTAELVDRRNGKAIYVARNVPRKRIWFARQVAEQAGVLLDVYSDVPHLRVQTAMPHYSYYLNTSLNEGMSRAMLEAMTCGIPVVTTPCGGQEVLDGKSGIVEEDEYLPQALLDASKKAWDMEYIRHRVLQLCSPESVVKDCLRKVE